MQLPSIQSLIANDIAVSAPFRALMAVYKAPVSPEPCESCGAVEHHFIPRDNLSKRFPTQPFRCPNDHLHCSLCGASADQVEAEIEAESDREWLGRTMAGL